MKNTSFFEPMLDETYLENVAQWTNQPVGFIKQVNQLTTGLMLACLYQQLQTDLGKGLVLKTLKKHAFLTETMPDLSTIATGEALTDLVTEGNRLMGTIIPGKKSAILRVVVHYAKDSFTKIDPLVGLCAYGLFTRLAFDVVSQDDMPALLPTLYGLGELTPELVKKDYIAVGSYSILSLPQPAAVA